MMKKLLFLVFIACSFIQNAQAEDGLTIVAVGKAEVEQDRVWVDNPSTQGPVSANDKNYAQEVLSIVRNDLAFYKKIFAIMDVKSQGPLMPNSVDYTVLKSKSIRFAVKTKVLMGNELEIEVHNVEKTSKILDKKFSISSKSRFVAHNIANEIYKSIVGKNAIFKHSIIFVSDVKSSNNRDGIKEVYQMDFDGKNVKQLTFHNGTVISPDISYDGKSIIYTLIRNTRGRNKTVDLYEMDLDTRKSRIISSKKGINSGAMYLPDGENIVLTLSHTGNAEIYKMNLKSGALTPITKHYAADVDPSINKDGTLMAFLSDRHKAPRIFTMDPRSVEKNVKQVSFVGEYSATPRFSPDGKEIVFTAWVDQRFDLFRINSDGSGLVRLTANFGSNEEPYYSPDGEFIIFSSQRVLSRKKAIQDIYIMDRDGEILGPLTQNFGNCLTPRWSK